MAIVGRSTLKGRFADGQTFTGSNAADWIDSFLHLSDTTAQSVESPVTFAKSVGFTTGLSAANIEITGTVSASAFQASKVSASAMFANEASFDAIVSASAVNVTTTISADEVYASAVVVNGAGVGPAVTSFGEIYLSSAQATTISAAGGYSESFGGTTLAASAQSDFDMPRDFTLRYTGSTEKNFRAAAHVSMSAAGNNKNVGMRLGKVAGGDSTTEIYRFIGTGANTGAASVGGVFKMAQNDTISLFVTNTTDTVAVTIHKCNMTVFEV